MSLVIAKPWQRLVLPGPDFFAVIEHAGCFVDVRQRPPLTEDEQEAFRDAGGEAAFYALNDRYDRIMNIDMPESLGPYEG